MRIGPVEIAGPAALAPMAGVGDRAFRAVCKAYGAAYLVGEMVSAKGLVYGSEKSDALLEVHGGERPMAVQLFGCEPALMARAARLAMRHRPDAIDINMGCPAPKITSGGAGSALMRSPRLAGEIVRAVAGAVEVPVTVKLRRGWDAEHENVVELAKICEDAGAAALTVHGRTREQQYAGACDRECIRRAVEAVTIPVIGNGDVVDGPSAARMLEETGCAMVMVGRGALGAPWVFAQIDAYLRSGACLPPPPLAERLETLCRQALLAAEHKGERAALREMRGHAAWYMKGLRGAAAFRREAGAVSTLADLSALCARVLEREG